MRRNLLLAYPRTGRQEKPITTTVHEHVHVHVLVVGFSFSADERTLNRGQNPVLFRKPFRTILKSSIVNRKSSLY